MKYLDCYKLPNGKILTCGAAVCVDTAGANFRKGQTYTIEKIGEDTDGLVYVDVKGGGEGWDVHRFEPVAPTLHVFKSEARSARDNAGKPESDYILTYPSGVDAVFSGAFPYYRTLDALHEWYVGEYPGTDRTVECLRTDAGNAGHDLVAALAETNTRAEKSGKYKQGNYLLGSNWRQYCQSAVRHAQALQKGETYDAEGNNHLGAFVFNILALDMCVTQNLGVDDRIRPPST